MKKKVLHKTRKNLQKTGNKGQCQCTSSCKYIALENSPFCSFHIRKCGRVSPLSGYEPDYNPKYWNDNYKIKETHNCFAYAYNVVDPKQLEKCKDKNCDVAFPQPGMASGHEKFKSEKPKTCPNMAARLFGDNSNVKMTEFTEKCPVGTSKIALIVDEDEDYHFLRQDSNGMWSHKPGARKVTNLDASGKNIYDPALADYNYKKNANGYLNYDNFCAYMCVPRITPVRIKTGGGKKTKKMKGGSTKKIRVTVLFNRNENNNDEIDLESCFSNRLIYVYKSRLYNDDYRLQVEILIPIDKLDKTLQCLETTFRDYKKNKVIEKFKIVIEED